MLSLSRLNGARPDKKPNVLMLLTDDNPGLRIAWKYLYRSKDTWLGTQQNLGAIGSIYNLTMEPRESYRRCRLSGEQRAPCYGARYSH